MRKIFTISCLLFFSLALQAQVKTFNKYFGTKSTENYPLDITILANNDLAIFAKVNDGERGDTLNSYLEYLRIDQNGKVIFLKKYFLFYSFSRTRAAATPDNGLIVFTRLYIYRRKRTFDKGAALIKFDKDGNVEWTKYIYSQHYLLIYPYDIIVASDGNYVMQYNLNDDYLESNRVGVMKVSPSGELIWNNTTAIYHSFFTTYEGNTIVEGPNGKIIVAGTFVCQYDDCFIPYNGILLSYDQNGVLEKHYRIPGKNYYEFEIFKVFYTDQKLVVYGDYVFEIDLNTTKTVHGTYMTLPNFALRKYPSVRPFAYNDPYYHYCYLQDGSFISIDQYRLDSRYPYQIQVLKTDSLSRTCPTFEGKGIDTNAPTKNFQVYNLEISAIEDSIKFLNLEVSEVPMDSVITVCEGVVPEGLAKQNAETKPTKISIYPNPVNDILHIRNLDPHQNYQLSISTSLGNVVRQATANKVNVYDWQVGGLKEGMYYLSIRSGDKNIRLLFMKE